MSKHLGDYDASAVIYGKFTTYQPSTGAPFLLAGTPVLSVYKDNSLTQSTTGVTMTANFDSVTGLNHYAIDTSADGTFYSAGSFFDIVITTGTVDGVSVVGSVVASFTIHKDSALKPATAGRTLVVDSAGLADATVVKVGPSGSATTQTARDIGASVLLSSGTGTGQILLSSGKVSLVSADIGAVWDVVLSGHTTAGTTGFALNAAASAGDPWATALPGAYGAGTAGKIIGDNINATVSSRLATTGYTTPPTATQNADALLKRDMSAVTGESARSPLNVFRLSGINKLSILAGVLTAYKENDSTPALTRTLGTDGAALPIVSSTP